MIESAGISVLNPLIGPQFRCDPLQFSQCSFKQDAHWTWTCRTVFSVQTPAVLQPGVWQFNRWSFLFSVCTLETFVLWSFGSSCVKSDTWSNFLCNIFQDVVSTLMNWTSARGVLCWTSLVSPCHVDQKVAVWQTCRQRYTLATSWSNISEQINQIITNCTLLLIEFSRFFFGPVKRKQYSKHIQLVIVKSIQTEMHALPLPVILNISVASEKLATCRSLQGFSKPNSLDRSSEVFLNSDRSAPPWGSSQPVS